MTTAALLAQLDATRDLLASLPEQPQLAPARAALAVTLAHLQFRHPGPSQAPEGSEYLTQHDIQLALGARPDLLLMRRNVGTAKDPDTGRLVRFGTPGEADLQGVLRVSPRCPACGASCPAVGLAVALEVKSPTGRQALAQRLWQAAWERRGGLYRVVRSVEDAERALLDAQALASPEARP